MRRMASTRLDGWKTASSSTGYEGVPGTCEGLDEASAFYLPWNWTWIPLDLRYRSPGYGERRDYSVPAA